VVLPNKIWTESGQQYPFLILKLIKMKKIFLLGTFALLTTTLFSCTADEYETQAKKEIAPTYADGPGDQPIVVPPPPPK
jgi:hypothetical protein